MESVAKSACENNDDALYDPIVSTVINLHAEAVRKDPHATTIQAGFALTTFQMVEKAQTRDMQAQNAVAEDPTVPTPAPFPCRFTLEERWYHLNVVPDKGHISNFCYDAKVSVPTLGSMFTPL